MLCDTGPLVALIDRMDPYYDECLASLESFPVASFTTTWPCITEAMYLLYRAGGAEAQNELWSFVADGFVTLDIPEADDWQKIQALMTQYDDMPLDLADASLIVAAERRRDWRLFSFDRRLRSVQLKGRRWLQVVP
jgi:uncharacterized protein